MAITDAKISSLMKQYEEKIQDALEQIEIWTGVAEQFKTKKEVLDELSSGTAVDSAQTSIEGVGKYAGLDVTPAVLAVLNDSNSSPISTGEIITILENEGFHSKSKHWKAAVYTACKRLSETGKILEIRKQGKKAFMKKP
jgi:hypothetical protein